MNHSGSYHMAAVLRAELRNGISPGPHPEIASQSPSINTRAVGSLPAFEVKFLLSESCAANLEHQLAERLTFDPHADPTLGHAYQISTLYADTPRFDVYHRLGLHKYRKFRLRRYGSEELTYVERKTKRGQRVRKRREALAPGDYLRIDEPEPAVETAVKWYCRQWSRHALRPVCQVSYARKALFGSCVEGPLRVTFDRNLRALAVNQLKFDARAEETLIGDGRVICEFKFRGHMPAIFKLAIETFQIVPAGFSKYRNAVRALGLIPATIDAKGVSDA